jgi:hypothetical protein
MEQHMLLRRWNLQAPQMTQDSWLAQPSQHKRFKKMPPKLMNSHWFLLKEIHFKGSNSHVFQLVRNASQPVISLRKLAKESRLRLKTSRRPCYRLALTNLVYRLAFTNSQWVAAFKRKVWLPLKNWAIICSQWCWPMDSSLWFLALTKESLHTSICYNCKILLIVETKQKS